MRWSRAGLSFLCCPIFRFFTSIPLANYSVHPTPPPRRAPVQKHCWGQRRSHRKMVQNSWVTERGRSGCKTKHCWGLGRAGSVSPPKSGPESSLCIILHGSPITLVHLSPEIPGTRADEGGGPSQGFLYGCLFYLKWRWALNQEITGSAAQQGWCPRSAACNSWCIHHPAFVLDGRKCYCWNRGWEARRPDLAETFARMGAGRFDGPNKKVHSSPLPPRSAADLSKWLNP